MTIIETYRKYLPDLQKIKPNEWRAKCPFHKEDTPSFFVNEVSSKFYCFGCAESGNLTTFLRRMGATEDVKQIIETERIVSFSFLPPEGISSSVVQQLHRNLMNDTKQLEYLIRKRRLSLFVIKKFLIGYDTESDRIAFPIKSRSGKFVNIKLHNSDKIPKSLSWRSGSGKARIYPVATMLKRRLVITEGEFDALLLHSQNYNGVTTTAGASSFPSRWYPLFKDKEIKLLLDHDEAGEFASSRLLAGLRLYAKNVEPVNYPAEYVSRGVKDVTDFVAQGGNLKKLIGDWR